MSEIRIGSRVAKEHMNDDGEWSRPDDEPVGTVVGIKSEVDMDGWEEVESYQIRWDNGRVETLPPNQPEGDNVWCIADVTPDCYLNLYLHDRAYGGPQEGGWWYDMYTPAHESDWCDEPPRHGHFETPAAAEEALAALQSWCNEQNENRRSPSSMASEGHFVPQLEAWPAESVPKQRPQYC